MRQLGFASLRADARHHLGGKSRSAMRFINGNAVVWVAFNQCNLPGRQKFLMLSQITLVHHEQWFFTCKWVNVALLGIKPGWRFGKPASPLRNGTGRIAGYFSAQGVH